LVATALYEWAAQSPLLFMLNKKEVALYKLRFANSVVTGNYRISALREIIGFPPNSDRYLAAELRLSYIPPRTKLVLNHLQLTKKTEHEINYKTLGAVEMGREAFEKFLEQEIKLDFFDSYFLRRNTPSNEEIPIIKDVIKRAFERGMQGSRVISVFIAPATSGSVDNVAVDKLYKATIKYIRNGQQKEILAYYGNARNYWIVPRRDDLERLERSTNP